MVSWCCMWRGNITTTLTIIKTPTLTLIDNNNTYCKNNNNNNNYDDDDDDDDKDLGKVTKMQNDKIRISDVIKATF